MSGLGLRQRARSLFHRHVDISFTVQSDVSQPVVSQPVVSQPVVSQYPYGVLDSSKQEIRLLEVLSDAGESQVRCRLVTASLLDDLRFTSLSYVWGAAGITTPILVDGLWINVTTNLAAALRHVKQHWQLQFPGRSPKEFRIWADAICINQGQVDEVNAQLQLMHALYTRAELNIAWLGSGQRLIELAVANFDVVARHVQGVLRSESIDFGWLEQYQNLRLTDDETGQVTTLWDAFTAFVDLPYFTRVWIFQEVVLGQNNLFVHGTYSATFDDVSTVNLWFHKASDVLQMSLPTKPERLDTAIWLGLSDGIYRSKMLMMMQTIKWIRETPQDSESYAFRWRIPQFCGTLSATDPRDHIYGLLAVTSCPITPDKRKGLAEVYQDFAAASLADIGRADWLLDAGDGLFDYDRRLPSWTPNWHIKDYYSLPEGDAGTRHVADQDVFLDDGVRTVLEDLRLQITICKVCSVEEIQETFHSDDVVGGRFFDFVAGYVARRPKSMTGIHPLKALTQVIFQSEQDNDAHLALTRGHVFANACLAGYSASQTAARDKTTHAFALLGLPDNLFIEDPKSIATAFLDAASPVPESLKLGFRQTEVMIERNRLASRLSTLEKCHRIFEAGRRYVGVAPKGTRRGDVICVAKGCTKPLALRKVEDHYILLGSCWVPGLMQGQAAQLRMSGQIVAERIQIW